jgi:hypothetical protein
MKLDPGMYIGIHLVFFGKSGVTAKENPTQESKSALVASSGPHCMSRRAHAPGNVWTGVPAGEGGGPRPITRLGS